MGFGFQRIIDLSALSIKRLNDQLEQLWMKVMGGIERKDLSGGLVKIIDEKLDSDGMIAQLFANQSTLKLLVGGTDTGDNLIVNGNGAFREEGWEMNPAAEVNIEDGGFLLPEGGEIVQWRIPVEEGFDYTFGLQFLGQVRIEVAAQRPGIPYNQPYKVLADLIYGDTIYWMEGSQSFTIPAFCNTVYVRLKYHAPVAGRVRKIFLRKGRDQKTYTQNPNEITGSSVQISQGMVDIRTPNFRLDLLNEDYQIAASMRADKNGFDKVICQNLNLRGVDLFGESQTLYVDSAAGNDCNDGSSREKAFRTIGKALHQVPLSHYEVKLYLGGRDYYEDLVFDRGGNGALHIFGEGARLFGSIEVANSCHMLHLYELKVFSSRAFGVKSTAPGALVCLENCLLDCNTAPNSAGALFAYGSRGVLTGCQINNCTYAVHFSYLAMGGMTGCRGKKNMFSLYTDKCGYLLVDGTVPHGSVMLSEENGGTVYGDFIYSQLSTDYREPSLLSIRRFDATGLATKQNETWVSGILRQGIVIGEQGEETVNRGFLLFPRAQIRSQMLHKSIQSCRLVVRRSGSDPIAQKQLEVWAHGGSRLSGSPTLRREYGVLATAAAGEEISLPLPVEIIADFISGQVYGICFYTEAREQERAVELDAGFLPYLEVQYQ